VSHKTQWRQRNKPSLTEEKIQHRIEKALSEDRTKQALELARALYKQDPSAENIELVKKATLARARQLRVNGYERDAITVLTNASELGGEAFLNEVALQLAACGQSRAAMKLLEGGADTSLRPQVLNRIADAAITQGPSGRSTLPPDLQPQFDMVHEAFRRSEAGEDDAARAALQGIGLGSPFLEWKVFLRGLLAYYRNEDARALENWQRLDPQRMPAQLAAPFRYQIDPAYRHAQSPEAQSFLQRAVDRLQDTLLLPHLRAVQAMIGHVKQLPEAFRRAEIILPTLKDREPKLVPRLAACFYWAIIHHGMPEDKIRLLRVFGPQRDDPVLTRLEALALERRLDLDAAHTAWAEYEKTLEQDPAWGDESMRKRARALVWCRMGHNDSESSEDFPFERPRLEPDAATCFKRAIELAPDLLEAHKALFDHYLDRGKNADAVRAATGLLEKFPDHVPTLETLGNLYVETKRPQKGWQLLERALHLNPLEKRLRGKLSFARQECARTFAKEGRMVEAARHYQAALAMEESDRRYSILAAWAAAEFKVGQADRGEELLGQARASAPHPALVAYQMAIEAARLPLSTLLKKRFTNDFMQALDTPPSTELARYLVAISALYHADKTYRGQAGHEKKILTYLESAGTDSWNEEHLVETCENLMKLGASKQRSKLFKLAYRAFPRNPVFIVLEVKGYLQGRSRAGNWRMMRRLRYAEELVAALPPEDPRRSLLQEIHDCRRQLKVSMRPPPSLRLLKEIFGGFSGEDDDDYFD
jgi:tetratricopeptide (TPR) repeat protein